MELKQLADNITEFLKRYRDVEDVFTDKRGFEILSDFPLCAGAEWDMQLIDNSLTNPTETKE